MKLRENMSQKQYENYVRLAEIIQWGRKYPIKFVERFFGIELLDYQKYTFMNSWTVPYCVWCKGRSSGKTTLAAPFIMAKSVLIPNWQAYIMGMVGSQSQETFMKIEKIAKKEIASFTGLTDVFVNELVKNASNQTGFTHNPASFQYSVFNGSRVNSLNGAPDSARSKRSNLNFYDEAGFIPDELFISTEPFTTQSSDFKLGGNVQADLYPRAFPNQQIYASSASSVDTYFFKKYKEYSKNMLLGDNRYFVADISSDIVLSATHNGKVYPVPLITQSKIDQAMREDPEKAMREYKNIFTTEGGSGQIIKRATIIRNTQLMKPCLTADGSKFLIAYDPARNYDQSVVMIARLVDDPKVGYMLELVNCVSFVDISKKKKTPLRTPEQTQLLRQLICDYNGEKVADYENIELFMIDAGAGGGGMSIGDYFLEPFVDRKGVKHKGLIDKEFEADYASKYPNSSPKKLLVSPNKYKKEMFDALIEMINLDLIKFPYYDDKEYLNFSTGSEDGKLIENMYRLSMDEQVALKQIEMAKGELLNIYRYDSTSGYRYDLTKEKTGRLFDDRAFCVAMLAWQLQNLRRKNVTQKQKRNISASNFLIAPKLGGASLDWTGSF